MLNHESTAGIWYTRLPLPIEFASFFMQPKNRQHSIKNMVQIVSDNENRTRFLHTRGQWSRPQSCDSGL